MADELDPIAPAVPAAVVDPPAPPADPDEAQAIEVQGGKMVPLAALKAARDEAKAGKAAVERVQQLEAELARAKPYQTFVEQHPQILQQPKPHAPAPDADPELMEVARLMDYYKTDGSPDLDRAAKYNTMLTTRAQRIAQQMVQPVAQSHAQSMSNANWTAVVNEKLPNGQPIDQKLLADMWVSLERANPGSTADPRVAAMVRDLTIAEQGRRSPLPPNPSAPLAPPVHTENLGRTPPSAARMTATEKAVATTRGMTEEKYTSLTKDFVPGRMNPLED